MTFSFLENCSPIKEYISVKHVYSPACKSCTKCGNQASTMVTKPLQEAHFSPLAFIFYYNFFYFFRPTDPPLRKPGRRETKIKVRMAQQSQKIIKYNSFNKQCLHCFSSTFSFLQIKTDHKHK